MAVLNSLPDGPSILPSVPAPVSCLFFILVVIFLVLGLLPDFPATMDRSFVRFVFGCSGQLHHHVRIFSRQSSCRCLVCRDCAFCGHGSQGQRHGSEDLWHYFGLVPLGHCGDGRLPCLATLCLWVGRWVSGPWEERVLPGLNAPCQCSHPIPESLWVGWGRGAWAWGERGGLSLAPYWEASP